MIFAPLAATKGVAASEADDAPMRAGKPCNRHELRLDFPWLLVQAERVSAVFV
jgi:hypothetical protein